MSIFVFVTRVLSIHLSTILRNKSFHVTQQDYMTLGQLYTRLNKLHTFDFLCLGTYPFIRLMEKRLHVIFRDTTTTIIIATVNRWHTIKWHVFTIWSSRSTAVTQCSSWTKFASSETAHRLRWRNTVRCNLWPTDTVIR